MSSAELISILLIALSLSADCFAVSLGVSCGLPKLRYTSVLRTALAFGTAQAVMTVLGWLAGSTIVKYIGGFDQWIAFILLAIIGGRMIWEAYRESECEGEGMDITRGWLLLTVTLATSIDALAAGLSLGFIRYNILFAALTIGVVTLGISHLGFYIGRQTAGILGKRAKLAGGIILICLGLSILIGPWLF